MRKSLPLLLALCSFSSLVCLDGCAQLMGDKDNEPGDPVGVYTLNAVVDVGSSSCPEVVAAAPNPWTFQVTLRRDGTTGYWLSGADPLQGTIADTGAITFTATIPTPVHDVEKAKGVGACTIDRTDQFSGSFAGDPSTDAGKASFSGTLVYMYAVESGSDCSDVVGQPSEDDPTPLFSVIPCTVKFNVTATKTGDAQ